MPKYLVILMESADRGNDPMVLQEEERDAARPGEVVVGRQFRMANADDGAVWPMLTTFEVETDDPQAAVESIAGRSGARTAGDGSVHAFLFEAIGERTAPAGSLSAGRGESSDVVRDG